MGAEGRSYFLMYEQAMEEASATISGLQAELRELKTIKGANRNLREVRKAARNSENA